jgi:hypothetical protein
VAGGTARRNSGFALTQPQKLSRFEAENSWSLRFPEERNDLLDMARKVHTEEESLRVLKKAKWGESVGRGLP